MRNLQLSELFNVQHKNGRAADGNLNRVVGHDWPHLTHVRQRPQHLTPLAANVVNNRLDDADLVILDTDNERRIALTQKSAGRREFGRT